MRELGFITIVEGIETEEVAKKAIGFGADMLQGFYFGRPQPADFDWKNHLIKGTVPAAAPIVTQQSNSLQLPAPVVQ